MQIFVTGATGFIGSAIVDDLLRTGHSVLGLARDERAADALRRVGAQPHLGDLANLDSLQQAARQTDGVIHTAFIHDFSDYAGAGLTDRRAVEAIGTALAGSNRPFVSTSVTTLLRPGIIGTERDRGSVESASATRLDAEAILLDLATQGVCSSIVRLPPSVHGLGDHALIPALIAQARANGVSFYIDDGANRWAAVHRFDAARLFCLALENAEAGSVLHAVSEEAIYLRSIAEAIGEGLDLPVQSVGAAAAADKLGWLAHFAAVDNPVSAQWTRDHLCWTPTHSDLFTDMRDAAYFSAA